MVVGVPVEFDPVPWPSPLGVLETMKLQDRMAVDQWDAIRDEFGVIAAYERTYPRYWRRRVRRVLRQFRNAYLVVLTGTYLSVGVVGPVAHGMGWW
ncbi:hypothetical protein APR03_002894 [Promicromonospora thailandica]|uniref:Uncharacterized protein n=1 Tax=Promicromonospora thailandica TaxID=765201 RepID=A0A9X2G4H0_9MICO|nr:hypothetical protein [Promicromonospora thailandica]BFF17104.1 hypothetical protein GCM10025730_06250 [Promicromonospora thailandica]